MSIRFIWVSSIICQSQSLSTYLQVLCRSLFLVFIQLLRALLVRWVSQVRSEQPQVLFFLCCIFNLSSLELFGFSVTKVQNFRCKLSFKVVKHAFWHFLSQILKSESRSTQLSYLLYFEFFGLLFHALEEDGKVLRNLIRPFQVLEVFTSV